MQALAGWESSGCHANTGTLVPKETLLMLSAVLKTAFRLHCTGEAACGKGPWQLVEDVERKLLELSQEPATVISEGRLARYVETELSEPLVLPAPLPGLAEVA